MPGADDEWDLRWQEVVHRWTAAVDSQGHRAGATWLAKQLHQPVERVQSYLSGRVRPRPEFVRAMAESAGIAPAELFVLLAWLPPDLGGRVEPGVGPWQIDSFLQAVERVERLAPLLRAARRERLAPATGAEAVLSDHRGALRYRVTLSRVVSGTAYRLATHAVAAFEPVPGSGVLPYAQAEELARAAGVDWRPAKCALDEDPEYWSRAVELRALAEPAIRGLGEYSWQGQPGTRGWQPCAPAWPAHLLTQDPYAGVSRAIGDDPAMLTDGQPIVVVGNRYYAGALAAMLAEALDWQFVLVRGDLEVGSRGEVSTVRRGTSQGRALAWSSVAGHAHQVRRSGGRWPAVLLVRPYVFRADRAVDLLAALPARIIYPRPPDAYLTWWEARQRLLLTADSTGHNSRAPLTRTALDAVERILAGRPGRPDLPLALPDPPGPLAGQGPGHPDHLVHWQFRAAWTALRWLNRVANRGRPSLLYALRPGLLAGHAGALSEDPQRDVPLLSLPAGA